MLLFFLESGSERPYQRCHAEWPEIVCPFAKGSCTQIRCQSHAFTHPSWLYSGVPKAWYILKVQDFPPQGCFRMNTNYIVGLPRGTMDP